MTMEKLKLCVRWSACRGSPGSISSACFKQEEQTKLMYFSCSNGNSSAFENSLESGYSFASAPVRCRKTLFGTVIVETGRDCGTTAQLSDLSTPFQLCASPLKGEVRRSRRLSARSAAANGEKRQISTCLFADSVVL